VDLEQVTVETFAGREGERFWITFADGEFDLELTLVRQAPDEWGSTGKRKQFSLIFHGTLEHLLPAQIWQLEHDELGTLGVFMVPVGPNEANDAMRYEVVFA
jgi:hypothetical protein